MSQSAENQSAIIENENNSNIVMESQAAMSSQEENADDVMPEEGYLDNSPQTPIQDEAAVENMDVGDQHADDQDDGEAELVGDSGDASQPPGEGFDEDALPNMGASGDAFLKSAEEAPSPAENQQEAAEGMEMEGDPEIGQELQESEPQESLDEPQDEPQEPAEDHQDLSGEDPGEESQDGATADQEWVESADTAREEDGEAEGDGIQQENETEPHGTDEVSQDVDTGLGAEDQDPEDGELQQEADQDDQELGRGESGVATISAEDEDRLLAEESQDPPQAGNEEQQLTDDQTSQDADEMRQDEGVAEEGDEHQSAEDEHQLVDDEVSQDKTQGEGARPDELGVNESMDASQEADADDAPEVIEDESQGAFSAAGDESNAAAEESHSGLDLSAQAASDDGTSQEQDLREDHLATEEETAEEIKRDDDEDVSIIQGEKAEGEDTQAGDANTSEDTIEDHDEVLEVKDDDEDEEANKESEPQSDEKIIADLVADVTKKVAAKVDGVLDEGRTVEAEDDDDDVVVIGDEPPTPRVKKEVVENDMGIQITSVSGGADHVHQQAIKQENVMDLKPILSSVKSEPQSTPPAKKPGKTQTCIVCQKVGKCKYNIVRNGDIKHLCDDTCFKRFRTNPTMFLKGKTSQPPASEKNKTIAPKALTIAPASPAYKTCIVCQLMNINTQGQFCMWKGLDFCGEGCLGKFQASISTSCTLCTSFIPLTARSSNCLRIGNEVRPFCSSRCYTDYKLRMRLCTFCQKDLSTTSDSFSAPMGSDGCFKDFCTQTCMKKYEDLLSSDVEILRVEPGKQKSVHACSVCKKNEVAKHSVKYNNVVNHLCSDPCLSAFQYANKLDMAACDNCGSLCTQLEASAHAVQFEGNQKRFCSDTCVTKFRFSHRKVSPCSWCGTARDNFDMIERLDASNKYQLFCSLNCLSLYRVNLQAKSNQAVTCDQCMKFVPAQYHLTMSDASVRNFCSYNCVMTFQAQFSKPQPPAPTPPTPRHKHNTRGKGTRTPQVSLGSPSFPIISNVVSLAPQGGQKLNIKNTSGAPVVVSGVGHTVKTTGVGGTVQQQIIIQPPPPKQVKNKALLCKPFTQTKATSCRPHTQTKEAQTDEVKAKPVLIPVPIPIYLPTPCALYSAPAPTPIFIPLPIPVPIFIPTTRKSANGILKQIKEIREKTPADPLEAEILMMAAAVSADGKNSSESDTDDDMLPDVGRGRKRVYEDDDDANIMPLTSVNEDREEDMISMALRMAEEMSGPMTDLESAVEPMPVNTEPPPQQQRQPSPDISNHEVDMAMLRRGRGGKRGSTPSRRGSTAGRPPKRPRVQPPPQEPISMRHDPLPPPQPPADANYHLKFTYGVNAWRHWVVFKNTQIERNAKPGTRNVKLFKTDIMQCTPDELNFSLCLFVKEVRKPNGEEYSPDSIYYLCLGIQQYLFENGRIDNIFADIYYEKFTEVLTEILAKCQPKFNAAGQMVCRIEEEHLWECKQLGAHSPYVLLNTLIYFHTKYFMLKAPEDHMKLSFAHILKYWKKGGPGKGGQPTRSVSLRYYSVSTAKKDGSAPTSTTKKGSKEGIPVYEVTENQDNPLRCPVKLYEFYLSKCPESIKNRSDIFYPVPERSCVPDSPVWYSTIPIGQDIMTKMLTRILLVREIQEAHLHAQPIYV